MKKNTSRVRSKPNLLLPLLAVGALLLVLGGVLLALDQVQAPEPVSPGPQAVSTIPDEHGEDGLPYPNVPRVTAAEAKAKFDGGQAILVDVRSQGEFETAHAQGATLLSLADLEARYRELPRDAEIILYCT